MPERRQYFDRSRTAQQRLREQLSALSHRACLGVYAGELYLSRQQGGLHSQTPQLRVSGIDQRQQRARKTIVAWAEEYDLLRVIADAIVNGRHYARRVGLWIVDVSSTQMVFAKPGQQHFSLRVRSGLENFRELARQPLLHREASLNGAGPILRTGQQGDPVVVKIADVFVGDVVDAFAQVPLHPGMLGRRHRLQERVFNPILGAHIRSPEPELPESLQRLHLDGRFIAKRAFRQRLEEFRTVGK